MKKLYFLPLILLGFLSPLFVFAAQNSSTISSLEVYSYGTSSVNIGWRTSVESDSTVEYGLTSDYTNTKSSPTISYSGLPGSGSFHGILITGLQQNTEYHYRVISKNSSGYLAISDDKVFRTPEGTSSTNSSATSSNIVTSPDVTPPKIPSNISVNAISPNQINITWTAASDPSGVFGEKVSGIAGYKIARNGVVLTITSNTSFTDTSAAPNTSYNYVIGSYDVAGNASAPSTPVYVTTPIASENNSLPTSLKINSTILQTSAPNLSSKSTTVFYRTLYKGIRGDDVKKLQLILIQKKFLASGNDTGYFGQATENALKQFQCSKSIVCSGSIQTTGYGLAGQKTRAALEN